MQNRICQLYLYIDLIIIFLFVDIQLEESINQNVSLQSKIAQLESTLANREQEWLLMDSKYRKYLEKAKEVIKSTEPRTNGN